MKRRTINRRHFLRDTGVAITLPYLASMAPRTAWAEAAPDPRRRFVALFFPNGTDSHNEWRGEGLGLGTAHRNLEPWRDQFTLMQYLDNNGVVNNAAHVSATASFLTGNRISDPDVARNSISADQVIANAIGGATALRSLELGPSPYPGGRIPNDGRWSSVYNGNLSWSAPDLYNAPEQSPRAVFDRLFGDALEGERAATTRRRRRRSVLDYVREEARRLRRRVDPEDRQKLDQYLTAIREVERRIDASSGPAPGCGADVAPDDTAAAFPEHTRQMLDLLVLALQCDMTRVVTYMMDFGFGNQDFSFLVGGVGRKHHNLTHNDTPIAYDMHRQITTWYCDQYAYLLAQMAAIDEGNGTLLDNSMVLFGSALGDGRRHMGRNLPLIVGGGGAGTITPGGRVLGRHVTHSQLLLSMIQKMGVRQDTFGDADRPLAGF